MENMIILDISINPHNYAIDNNIPDGYWWCINKNTHYEFYYITE